MRWIRRARRSTPVAADRLPALVAVGLAVFATGSTFVATRHGVGVGPDAVTYLSAAHNLAHGTRFADFTGGPLTHFPPVFPALLALGDWAGSSLLSAARVINAFAMGATVWLSFLLLRRHVRATSVLIGATAFVAVTAQLLRSGSHAASDPLFVVLVLAFLLVLEGVQARPASSGLLIVAAAVLTWVGFLERYAGSSFLITGGLTIAVVSVKEGVGVAARRVGAFVLLGAVVPGLWLWRNDASAAHNFFAVQVQSPGQACGVTKIAHDMLSTGKHLLFPDRVPLGVAVAAVLLVAILVGAVAWICRDQLGAGLTGTARSLWPMVIFIIVYTIVLAAGDRTPGFFLDERLLLPIWLPLIVVAAWFFDQLLAAAKVAHHEMAVALGAGGALLIGLTAIWALQQTVAGAEPGYQTLARSNAELRGHLANVPASGLVLSNDPWRTYFATGHQPTLLAPMPIGVGFSHRPVSEADLFRERCAQPVTLVWFSTSPASKQQPVTSAIAGGQVVLGQSSAFDGGVVYQLALAPGASCPHP